jgi:hypothetical protein
MSLPAGTKIRVVYCENFPDGEHMYKSFESITDAIIFLRLQGLDNQYTPELYPMQGSKNFAIIEYFDENSNAWMFYNE